MTSLPATPPRPERQAHTWLWLFAAGFMLLYAVMLTVAPAVRLRTWQTGLNWSHWAGFAIWLIGFLLLYRQVNQLAVGADPFLVPLMALLTGWGLMTIFRLSDYMGLRQSIWLGVGLGLFWYLLRLPTALALLRRYKYIWLVSGLLITALTLIFGTYPGGTGPRLWLGCCGIYFQPSEPLKLLLVIYLATYLADRLPISFSLFSLLAPSLILVGIALLLLVVQRDLGTAALLILIYTLTLFIASGHRRMLLFSLAAILLAAYLGYRFSDVVSVRVDSFLYPWRDPSDSSYQIVQSLLAVASGGLIGRGPGLGSPGVVPVAVSDFIYPALVEETGLLGAAGLLLAYALLVVRALIVGLRAPFRYQRYLGAGIAVYFAVQVLIIIGGNLRMLPLTGVTLPFLSYGGSSLLTSMAGILILMLISRQSDQDPAPISRSFAYLSFFAAFNAGVVLVLFATGWYGIVRQEALLTRTDNPRRSITDRYVLRGAILDRNNQPIARSTGSPGSYTREYLYPALSLTTGYSDPMYGQSAIEASQDEYLRGLKGSPSLSIWWNRLLYGEPPPGLDLRLTIDLALQKAIDQAIGDHVGAGVLLNAQTGEILALASHPYFDANHIASDWDRLVSDPESPLLNRVTQGLYPPGLAITPMILSEALVNGELPDLPNQLNLTTKDGFQMRCAIQPDNTASWSSVLSSGCPSPVAALGNRYLPVSLDTLFKRFGLSTTPAITLPVSNPVLSQVSNPTLASLGEDGLLASPLQIALMASVISNGGNLPQPIIPMAVNTPRQGWVIISESQSTQVITANRAARVSQILARPGKLYWEVVALTNSGSEGITWFVAGTITEWKGSPLALAIVLEEANPQLAMAIGHTILDAALNSE